MIRLAVVFVCLSFACATPDKPAQYKRGTLRPPPPALRPGHGLPTYEPHPEVKPLQPQPKQAPVPHTARTAREDTIWAPERGSGPRASAGDDPKPKRELFNFFKEDIDMREMAVGDECRKLSDHAIQLEDFEPGSTISKLSASLPSSDWRCFIVKAYKHCVDKRYRDHEKKRAEIAAGIGTGEYPIKLSGLKTSAANREKEECHGPLPAEAAVLLRKVGDKIDKLLMPSN